MAGGQLTAAQELVLQVVDQEGAAALGAASVPQASTVNISAARALVRTGVLEEFVGPDGPCVRRREKTDPRLVDNPVLGEKDLQAASDLVTALTDRALARASLDAEETTGVADGDAEEDDADLAPLPAPRSLDDAATATSRFAAEPGRLPVDSAAYHEPFISEASQAAMPGRTEYQVNLLITVEAGDPLSAMRKFVETVNDSGLNNFMYRVAAGRSGFFVRGNQVRTVAEVVAAFEQSGII